MITLALPWTIIIRTADGPYVSLDVGNVNTSEDALATVQAITALLSFPDNKDTRAWLIQRFSREWLAPLLELAKELPPAFWVDILDPTGHRCHTGVSPVASLTDQEGLDVVKVPRRVG